MGGDLRRRLWLIFGLGALQGAVGWWMVASGLSTRVEVSQYRLATHLVLALLIFAAIVWTLRGLTERPLPAVPARLRATSLVLLVLTFVQLYFGALVAGLRAGLVYNTWPAIDGDALIPSAARLWFEDPWWRNLFENALTVQFEHRMTAYALLALAVLHALDAVRARAGAAAMGAWWLVAVILVQASSRNPDAALPGADLARARASGGGDRRPDAGGAAGGTAGRAADAGADPAARGRRTDHLAQQYPMTPQA